MISGSLRQILKIEPGIFIGKGRGLVGKQGEQDPLCIYVHQKHLFINNERCYFVNSDVERL